VSFQISNLKLQRFRNYEDKIFEFDPNVTILWGSNAVGKTSTIEAIQVLCEATSFRKPSYEDMIQHGEESAVLELSATDGERTRDVTLIVEPHTKSYKVNGKKTTVSNGILGIIPVIVFAPDNLSLVKDSAGKRRDEIDALGQQLSKNYTRLLKEYSKALRGRNRLLSDGYCTDPAFDAWSDQLAAIGAVLYRNREKLLERLIPIVVQQYASIDPEATLEVAYENNWGATAEDTTEEVEQKLRDALDDSFIDECARKITLVGPHRDDIVFRIDGHDVRSFGSQGQQRTVALSWKLAEVSLIEEMLGVKPILLLDDVMSELDESRRNALMGRVGEAAQTIITTTNIHYFETSLLDRARVIEISSEKCRDG